MDFRRSEFFNVHTTNRRNWPRELVADFIAVLRDNPSVWDLSSPQYRDHALKKEGLDALTEKLQEHDSTADVEVTKRTIAGLRACYRKESNRELEAMKRKQKYKATLWYYDQLRFLSASSLKRSHWLEWNLNSAAELVQSVDWTDLDYVNEEERIAGEEQVEEQVEEDDVGELLEEEEVERISEAHDDLVEEECVADAVADDYFHNNATVEDVDLGVHTEPINVHNGSWSRRSSEVEKRLPYLPIVLPPESAATRRHLLRGARSAHHEDSHDIYGRCVATRLRPLKGAQRLYAERLINDILDKASTNSLTTRSKVLLVPETQAHQFIYVDDTETPDLDDR